MSQNMTHTITLKAVDGTSVVFQRIGQSAQTAAAQVTAAGQKATAALNQEAAATDKAAASTTKFGGAAAGAAKGISAIHAAASGAAVAALVGGLSDASRAFEQAEAGARRLEATFEGADTSVIGYEQALKDATAAANAVGRSQGDAEDAIGRMVQISGDAEGSIKNLSLAMDIAAARHVSLETAANAVGRTMEGNFTLFQRMGVPIRDGADATEVLAEAQKIFAGQAEANVTIMDRYAVSAQNTQLAIGGIVSPLAGLLTILPGISKGFELAAAAGGVLGKALFGVAEAEAAVETAGAGGGLAAFAAAAAPALTALAAAAVVAAPAIVAVAAAEHQAAAANDEWNQSLEARNAVLEKVKGLGIDQTVYDITEAFRTWNTVTTVTVGGTTRGLEDLSKTIDGLDVASLNALAQYTEAIGGVTPDNIQKIAEEVARLGEVQRQTAGEQLGLADAQRAAIQPLQDYKAEQAGLAAKASPHKPRPMPSANNALRRRARAVKD
jgi:hypothetical protein